MSPYVFYNSMSITQCIYDWQPERSLSLDPDEVQGAPAGEHRTGQAGRSELIRMAQRFSSKGCGVVKTGVCLMIPPRNSFFPIFYEDFLLWFCLEDKLKSFD